MQETKPWRSKRIDRVARVFAKIFSWLFRLYGWLLSWSLAVASSRYAVRWILLFSYLEGIFFPIPPDVFLIARGIAKREGIIRLALLAAFFSVLGGATSYILGSWFFASFGAELLELLGLQASFDKLVLAFSGGVAFWTNFLFGFTILPFKVIALASGFASVPFYIFVTAGLLARGLRLLIVAILLKLYGARLQVWLNSRQAFVCSLLLASLCLLALTLYAL